MPPNPLVQIDERMMPLIKECWRLGRMSDALLPRRRWKFGKVNAVGPGWTAMAFIVKRVSEISDRRRRVS